jgi:hypothetical protein
VPATLLEDGECQLVVVAQDAISSSLNGNDHAGIFVD